MIDEARPKLTTLQLPQGFHWCLGVSIIPSGNSSAVGLLQTLSNLKLKEPCYMLDVLSDHITPWHSCLWYISWSFLFADVGKEITTCWFTCSSEHSPFCLSHYCTLVTTLLIFTEAFQQSLVDCTVYSYNYPAWHPGPRNKVASLYSLKLETFVVISIPMQHNEAHCLIYPQDVP